MALVASMALVAPALPAVLDDLDGTLDIPDLPAPGGPLPLFLEVFVNGESTELIAEFALAEDGTLSSPRGELIEVGLRVPALRGGMVPLDALDGVSYTYDPAGQTLHVTADARALRPEVISAHRFPPPVDPDRATGLVLNHDTVATFGPRGAGGGFSWQSLSIAHDGWLFTPAGRLESAGVAAVSGDGPASYIRLRTSFEKNLPGKALTLAAGDVVSSSLGWGRSVRIGGVQLRRDFGLRRDLVTEPLLSFGGAAAVPSTVDVYIDNNRVFSGRTSQGPYRFEDIPIYNGSGDAVVVVREEDGTLIRREVGFFATRNLLKRGVADYSLEVGRAREGYGTADDGYASDTLYAGSLRFGLTDRVTLEAHVEGKSDLTMLGVGAAFVVANRAEVTLSGGASQYQGRTGQFGYGTVRTRLGKLNLEASVLRATPGFTDLAFATASDFLDPADLAGDAALLEFPSAQDVLTVSMPVIDDRASLGLSYVAAERSTGSDRLVSVSFGRSMKWRSASLNLSGAYDFESDEPRFAAYLTMATGAKTFTQVSGTVNRDAGSSQGLTLTRALGDAVGDYGYQAQLDVDGGTPAWQAAARIRSRHGRGEVGLRRIDGQTSARARFDGAVVLMGGDVLTGSQIHDGFAVVDAGVPGASVYLQNREVARTDATGRALVPGLSSFGPNRVSLNVDELPKDASWNATAMEVVPARRSGVRVDFGGSAGGDAAVIVLRDPAGEVLPVGAKVRFRNHETVVGYDGVVYLEGLRATNALTAETREGRCTARFAHVPGGGVQDVIDPVVCG